ncbi:MAG: hypothetical protein EBU49_08080 [Proteobacteria bacterium]|nr:hypothetical protein [Pseudomonadota bacterium]
MHFGTHAKVPARHDDVARTAELMKIWNDAFKQMLNYVFRVSSHFRNNAHGNDATHMGNIMAKLPTTPP